jgi:hypothetical protein
MLTDAGSVIWALGAGGPGDDQVSGLDASGAQVYLAGRFNSSALTFGSTRLSNPGPVNVGFLAWLTDAAVLGTAAETYVPAGLYPNPASSRATLRLPAAEGREPVALTDALGRVVRRYPAPAGSEVTLDLRGLPAGLYLLRVGEGPGFRLHIN